MLDAESCETTDRYRQHLVLKKLVHPNLLGDLGTKGDAGDEGGKERVCSLREARAKPIDRSGVAKFHPCF